MKGKRIRVFFLSSCVFKFVSSFSVLALLIFFWTGEGREQRQRVHCAFSVSSLCLAVLVAFHFSFTDVALNFNQSTLGFGLAMFYLAGAMTLGPPKQV